MASAALRCGDGAGPAHLEQRVAGGLTGCEQRAGLDRAGRDRVDGEDRSAGVVDRRDLPRAVDPPDVHLGGRCSGAVQAHARQRERHLGPAGGVSVQPGQDRLQGGVCQRRMDPVRARRIGLRLVEADLGDELVGVPGDLPERVEGRPVLVARPGETVVEVVDVELDRVVGRQRDAERSGCVGLCGEGGGGVVCPVGVVGGAGVDGEVAAVVVVGFGDGEGDRDRRARWEEEWCVEGEFVDVGGAAVVGGVQGEFEERGRREQGVAEDGVVGEPGVALEGEAAGVEGALPGGEGDGGVEQGVVGGGLSERAGVLARQCWR